MNKQLEQVSEFNKALDPDNQPVYGQRILSSKRAKLRFALIFEELLEYATASGQIEEFKTACIAVLSEAENPNLLNMVNPVEQLDALADLQYVVNGLIYETGFSSVFDEAFERVHQSNMSKLCNDEEEAAVTVRQYKLSGVDTFYKETPTGKYTVMRESDKKVLKSYLYQPVYLKDLIHNEQ